MRAFILVLAVLGVASEASGQTVNRCKGPNGAITITDQACPSGQTSISSQVMPPHTSSSGAESSAEDNYNRYLKMQQEEHDRARNEARADERQSQIAPVYQQQPHSSADIDEQIRRCNMAKNSLVRKGDADCVKMRAMLNMPEPTRIIVNNNNEYHQNRSLAPATRFDQHGTPYTDYGNGGPVLNQQTGRMCTNLGGGNIRCD